jgi:hypothetical protein
LLHAGFASVGHDFTLQRGGCHEAHSSSSARTSGERYLYVYSIFYPFKSSFIFIETCSCHETALRKRMMRFLK